MPTNKKMELTDQEIIGKNSSNSQDATPVGYSRQVTFLVSYFLAILFFSLWLLFDVWGSNFVVFHAIGLRDEVLEDPLLRTIGFTIVGGILGSVLYQIRVLFYYYAKKRYDPHWFGKYLTAPWEGAGMAIVVLSLIRGGVALFGGSTGTDVTAVNNFAAIGTGALVGFGMRDVVGWLGHLVHTMFTIPGRENDLTSSSAQHSKRKNQTNK